MAAIIVFLTVVLYTRAEPNMHKYLKFNGAPTFAIQMLNGINGIQGLNVHFSLKSENFNLD